MTTGIDVAPSSTGAVGSRRILVLGGEKGKRGRGRDEISWFERDFAGAARRVTVDGGGSGSFIVIIQPPIPSSLCLIVGQRSSRHF